MTKYGSLLNGMATQYAMGHNQFPGDIQKAVDIMSNHRFDNQKDTNRKHNKNKNKESEKSEVKKESSFAQSAEKMVCYCCGKKGHGVPKCPERDSRKKEDWAVNTKKGVNHNQQESNIDDNSVRSEKDDTSVASSSGKKKGWSGVQLNFLEKKKFENDNNLYSLKTSSIILDNGSTLSIFGNPDMVTNIRKSDITLELATNAGTRECNKIADVPGFGTVWFDERAIANIFGLSDLKKKHDISYNSKNEDKFTVHMADGDVDFICNKDGLYEYKVSDDYLKLVAEKNSRTQGKSH
jgi:hypothetical protein